jgi:hypothetical protein
VSHRGRRAASSPQTRALLGRAAAKCQAGSGWCYEREVRPLPLERRPVCPGSPAESCPIASLMFGMPLAALKYEDAPPPRRGRPPAL